MATEMPPGPTVSGRVSGKNACWRASSSVPGCISVAITLGAHLRYQAGPGFEHGYPRHFIAAAGGMLLVCFLVVVCYGNAALLVRMLGQSGTSILTRLSAFILLAIGIQILWTGLSVGIPQMLGPAAH